MAVINQVKRQKIQDSLEDKLLYGFVGIFLVVFTIMVAYPLVYDESCSGRLTSPCAVTKRSSITATSCPVTATP